MESLSVLVKSYTQPLRILYAIMVILLRASMMEVAKYVIQVLFRLSGEVEN